MSKMSCFHSIYYINCSEVCSSSNIEMTRCECVLAYILPVPESTECGDCCVTMWWVSWSPSTAIRVLTPGWHHSLPSSDEEMDFRCCCQVSPGLYGANRLLCPEGRSKSGTMLVLVSRTASQGAGPCSLRKRQKRAEHMQIFNRSKGSLSTGREQVWYCWCLRPIGWHRSPMEVPLPPCLYRLRCPNLLQ